MKNFDEWNKTKKVTEIKNTEEIHVQLRDVWMATLGHNIGFEQDGSGNNFSRPVLVIKKFNHVMSWVIPLSSKQRILTTTIITQIHKIELLQQ